MNYKRSVSVELFNAGGTVETDPTLVTKYVYSITFDGYRPQDIAMPSIDAALLDGEGVVTPSATIEKLVSHSAPISGTYQILIDNLPIAKPDDTTNFSFDENIWNVYQAFNKKFDSVEMIAGYAIDVNLRDRI